MKKNLLFCCIAVAGLAMSSCKKEPENKFSFSVSTYNYVSFLDDSHDPVIKRGYYNYNFDAINNKVVISTDMVDLGDDNDSRFVTDPFPYNSSIVNFNGDYSPVYYGSDLNPCTDINGQPIKNLRFELTPIYYVPPTISYTPDPTSPLPQPDLSYRERPNGMSGVAPKMLYDVGDKYRVYTFWPDLYYKGVTKTSVNGVEDSSFESQDVGYRLKFRISEKKVDVVMYNVQFNPNMPKMECLILPDLDVKFTNNGFIVEDRNIVPLYVEGDHILENPRFPFTTFKFTAETNMVEGNCEFTVAGRFSGSFVGRYMEFVVR
ncbi:MAG: hypothetical protein K2N05_06585 [Muribaculaceae bacterium]|nr:hypothetical protein [Muribaculaceae bacterium]